MLKEPLIHAGVSSGWNQVVDEKKIGVFAVWGSRELGPSPSSTHRPTRGDEQSPKLGPGIPGSSKSPCLTPLQFTV